ncbi:MULTISPECIES: NAD(P)/FAD-dependent oxidoreductase [unclassified Streptomyces]|uniref:NAD(P)/FAD-dependent oxidoreductase n=1 Tax=unclassified Streptomyces TaxID=2593676 RepID=UPI001660AAA5|nr:MULTISPECIES: FAD-dependent oxidoreductase [unclassified Streptomyces]MBD0707586.1 pyridine nucleotide-disulfide oxidoreductase [Streptomyces sp. CBMA291]MBD0716367.1 pyridine nucleotide-disulfide oxidoreductase [Streptomyces sp. CBMA370]
MKTTSHRRPGHPTHRVLVLGAGYAGLITALRVGPHARVTLVDPADHFTERVRFHEKAAGRPDVTHPLSAFLHRTGIEHIPARATAIDTTARQVTTDDGRRLPYDRLVYALGSRTAPPTTTGEPRAYTAETAGALHLRLRDRPGSVAVVGGGLTGIEMAAELAETHRPLGTRVRLLTGGRVGAGLSPRGAAHVHRVLQQRGARVEEGRRYATPDEVDADIVVWATSFVPNTELAVSAGLALAPSGRIAVDTSLRSTSHPEVYVPGDAGAAAHPDAATELRMACATALPTGTHTADSIIRELRGEEPEPLAFGYRFQCVSLGRKEGLIQFVHPDDSPRDRLLTGRAAATFKELVVRGATWYIRRSAKRL